MDVLYYLMAVAFGFALINGLVCMAQFNKTKTPEEKLFAIKLASFGRKKTLSDEESAIMLSFGQLIVGFFGGIAVVLMVFKFEFESTMLVLYAVGTLTAGAVFILMKPKNTHRHHTQQSVHPLHEAPPKSPVATDSKGDDYVPRRRSLDEVAPPDRKL